MMVFLILALASGLVFLHPYVLYPLSLRLLRNRPLLLPMQGAAAAPSATLVFCAYNEAAAVPAKIENLRRIKALVPDIRFRAYVDKSTDGTAALLQEHPDLLDVHLATQRTGKALGMRRLVAASDSQIMIFTDANVVVEPGSIEKLLHYFADESVGGVCGTLHYVNPADSATAGVNGLYWKMEERTKKLETRSGSTMGADGSIFAVRRHLYPEVPGHLLDDFIVSMSVIFAGYRLISVPDVIAYERLATRSADEFRRKRRIACRAYSSHRYMAGRVYGMSLLNRYKYLSHRFVRWYGAAFAALTALFFSLWLLTTLGTGWALGAAACVTAVVGGILSVHSGPLARISEILRAVWATILGVIDAWKGKRYQTWQPAQSR